MEEGSGGMGGHGEGQEVYSERRSDVSSLRGTGRRHIPSFHRCVVASGIVVPIEDDGWPSQCGHLIATNRYSRCQNGHTRVIRHGARYRRARSAPAQRG
jgi:hypothetical protein